MALSELISIAANIGALSVVGVIYFAYIKNLRAIVELKNSQLSVAEQNTKFWKDKALELERGTPEFVERKLNERIRIREEEIQRLEKDTESNTGKISQKNKEIESLRYSLTKATEFKNSITVWDDEVKDFIEVQESELDHHTIGSICVDAATIMIGDPFYLKMKPEHEKEELLLQKHKFRVLDTGEYFCTDSVEDSFESELMGMDESKTVSELEAAGIIEECSYSGDLPAVPETYIKGDYFDDNYRKIHHMTFLNGRAGAGIMISLGGDGVYPVYAESYKGDVQRIIIEV